ncbi:MULTISPECIES: AfsR/SARP family transcriptional regulator [unclassified Crossiella]|uniref:AfsR/SARP family transcriptional regulator n=1 Tax=unclassified Crossiella TaxID=2620835 RepID=UPI001FFF38AE|nr:MULTISPECIES: AfsR/SARP family transcriptional regulator [unclassified Crossiella]MCK2244447.1 AfsR/SARP family transcriptional regulator [Crossiella sp. S99.2]MCK2258078.1 AfsR/SARP family transcriptional regulator [Crossiella sp. S99.1]
MKYEILGPLRVLDDNAYTSISARKVEITLAVLLIRADHVVSFDQLVTELWGDSPPRRVAAGVHVHISQLRKFLHRPDRADNPIVTHPRGYLLKLGNDELDFRHFLRLCESGRGLVREERWAEAADCLERALGLWRGPVLRDLGNGPIIDGFAAWLMESRLECLELLADCWLQLGRHRELVAQLYSLIAEYPLRETFYRRLMLALYRSDRQADALEVYRRARRTLHDELGLEPCRALQDLQRAILSSPRQLDLLAAG